jgi:hypothetical protein
MSDIAELRAKQAELERQIAEALQLRQIGIGNLAASADVLEVDEEYLVGAFELARRARDGDVDAVRLLKDSAAAATFRAGGQSGEKSKRPRRKSTGGA